MKALTTTIRILRAVIMVPLLMGLWLAAIILVEVRNTTHWMAVIFDFLFQAAERASGMDLSILPQANDDATLPCNFYRKG